MTLEEDYLYAFNALNQEPDSNISKTSIISVMDLTLLDEKANANDLRKLSEQAKQNQVAAVCVLPEHIDKISITKDIYLATVINFPEGMQTTSQLLQELEAIISKNTVHEIDYVFPHQSYMEGEQDKALEQCRTIYEFCQQADLRLKVILETGALPSLDYIYQLSLEVLHQGCHFLKTSTGKIAQGATPASAFAILKAIKDSKSNCGLKVSGGIKKAEQAFLYAKLTQQQWNKPIDKSFFRIGASSLLDAM